MSTTLLDAKLISKKYPNTKAATISNINMNLQTGEFVAIMGSSGSGKSTLLYLLSGLDELTSGEIRFQGEAIQYKTEREKAKFRSQYLGFVFQSHNLIPNLSLLENILVPAYLVSKDKKQVQRRAYELLEQVQLDQLAMRLPTQVSGGEKQRCAILRAIINQPAILMADEPTGNLNSAHSKQILSLFQDLHQQGQSILMVTHDIHSACYANRVIYLKDGSIVDELIFQELAHSLRATQLNSWLKSMGW